MLACWMGESLGRKKTVLIGTTVMSIGAILQITSYSLPQMFVGRVVAGKWCQKAQIPEFELPILIFSVANCQKVSATA
jgi:MFS family permease